MLLEDGRKGLALLSLAALLSGCTTGDSQGWSVADSGAGRVYRAVWGSSSADRLEDSDTIRRVRGAEPSVEPLRVEPGNVWPVEEAPRATLANPDAALRGVPSYRPGDGREGDGRQRDFAPPRDSGPRADAFPSAEPRPLELRRRRGGTSPPPSFEQREAERLPVLPPPPGAYEPPPRRTDGQVVLTPSGPVVTGGGTDRVQSFTTPGGGGGIITRDGGFTTISPSGGMPQTFPTPR